MMLSSSSSSSSSATVLVEKATSELLIGPDWTMNMQICDSINSNHWDAKDIVRAVKKRLQHKNPTVQLLSLTLVETMVKNCGDYVHFQIVEKNILQEMIKIIKKKTEMRVRDKILTLIDSWQEAFGGPGGKYPQYYWAYEELRRSGVLFPQRSSDSAPIFTPPVAQSTLRHAQAGYGMPSNSSSRLDEAMAAETGNLSIDSMRNALDLLADMLQAVNPSDRSSVKDEIIVDLVNQCRSNQKKLMQLLTTTGDEELLSQGLELNDSLQNVLAKHDAIASGSALPIEATTFSSPSIANNGSSLKPAEVKQETTNAGPSPQRVTSSIKGHIAEEEDLEDDFAQLARRHSKTRSTASEDTCTGTGEIVASVSIPSNALALPDPPAPVRTTKEQDMIDLLSLTLSTTTLSPEAPHTPAAASVSPTIQGYPNASQGQHGNQGQVPFNGYVAPWAQTQPQSQTQSQFQSEQPQQIQPQPYPNPQPQQIQPQPYPNPQPQQIQPQPYPNPQSQQIPPQPYPHSNTQLQIYPQPQPQRPQFSSGYPPPPWAPTPGYFSNQNHSPPPPYMSSTQQANPPPTYTAVQGARPSHQIYSVPARGINGSPMNGESIRNYSSPRGQTVAESKPFVPSYRLFEDLNVLGNGDGRFKTVSGTSSSLSGSSNPSMVGGRK